jgi:two-component system, chemotaxis family, protein-glutamate methylesterase/glutaminase
MTGIVVVGASAGGLSPLRSITESLPRTCKATLFIVVHTGRIPSSLPEILSWHGRMPVEFGRNGTHIEAGHIYVAPPDRHMLVSINRIQLSSGPLLHYTRPAIDPLFESAAAAFGKRVVGIVLSGQGRDGAVGLAAIKRKGGLALVQDPREAEAPDMPKAAISAVSPESLPVDAIARRVAQFCHDAEL